MQFQEQKNPKTVSPLCLPVMRQALLSLRRFLFISTRTLAVWTTLSITTCQSITTGTLVLGCSAPFFLIGSANSMETCERHIATSFFYWIMLQFMFWKKVLPFQTSHCTICHQTQLRIYNPATKA